MRRFPQIALSLTSALTLAAPTLAWQNESTPASDGTMVAASAPLPSSSAPLVGKIMTPSEEAATNNADTARNTPAIEAHAANAFEDAGAQAPTVQPVKPAAAAQPAANGKSGDVLKGSVTQDGTKSPLLIEGVVQSLPKNTKVDLTMMVNLNSEVTQKGSEIWCRVSHDVPGSGGVSVPGGWYAHGLVTDAAGQKRAGRDGFVEIEFDKLVSPEGDLELPFSAKLSTKDKTLKMVTRQVLRGSRYVGIGAVGGSLASVQMTGIPVAIATHGYSVAIGAGIGAAIGGFAALKNKGKIKSLFPGDEMKLVTAEPITLPGFNPEALLSAKPAPVLHGMRVNISKVYFDKDPSGDKSANMLHLIFAMNNQTPHEYSFCDLVVQSDHNQRYYPSIFGTSMSEFRKKVKPNTTAQGQVGFSVDGKKHKYWLVLLNRSKDKELMRVPIN